MLSVKIASVNDIALIQELTYKVWPQTYNHIIGEEQVHYMLGQFYTEAALRNQIEQQQHQFIIVFDEGEAVGFASYGQLEPGIFKLHKLYVNPDRQGKGLGAFIIRYIQNELASGQTRKLRLNVNLHNKNAIAFYYKTGFYLLKNEKIDIGNGFFMDDHVFELDI